MMNKYSLGILLLALLVCLCACGHRIDREDGEITTTPAPDTTALLPELTTTREPSSSDTASESADPTETTTQMTDTTTHKTETTTKPTETTTHKTETTTKAPETTTHKVETTTKAPETTTHKAETTTKAPETTTHKVETTAKPETTAQGALPAPEAGEWLHFDAFTDAHLGAAAYLGRSAAALSPSDVITALGLPLDAADIVLIDRGDSEDRDGDAWYLILPRHRDTTVRLYEAEDGASRTARGELIAEGMHPMLLRCDPDDGEPSVIVELTRGETTVTFAPRVQNGTAAFHEQVLDITPGGRMRFGHR